MSFERRTVDTLSGPTPLRLVTVEVDTLIRGTAADTIVVAFGPSGMKVPNPGDQVVMATNFWRMAPSLMIPAEFVRSAPVPGGLGTVDREGHWLGPVTCERGFASADPLADELAFAAPGIPRSPSEGPDLEREERERSNSVAWETASATLVQCLSSADR